MDGIHVGTHGGRRPRLFVVTAPAFDSQQYREDMRRLQTVDPTNTWNWRIAVTPPLDEPTWVCDVPTAGGRRTFTFAVFRNPMRGGGWEVAPVDPPCEWYPDTATVLEILENGAIGVVQPSPEPGQDLGTLPQTITAWITAHESEVR